MECRLTKDESTTLSNILRTMDTKDMRLDMIRHEMLAMMKGFKSAEKVLFMIIQIMCPNILDFISEETWTRIDGMLFMSDYHYKDEPLKFREEEVKDASN